jgi:hypothetical protein
VTPWRIIAIGLGGATAVLAAGAAGNMLGAIVAQALSSEWAGHATAHVAFGALVVVVALLVGRVHRPTVAGGWADRGVAAVRLIAFVVGATAFVEGIGAYPPLEVLHDIVYANVLAVLVLLVGFLFVGAVGVGRLVQGVGKPQPS